MKCDIRSREVDNGYGWIIVIMSFLIQLVVDGIIYSFGILMVELLEEFDHGRSGVAVTGSMLVGLLCFTGPFAAALCDKYGCRVLVVTGAIIGCAGLVISFFASSIIYLYISFSIVTGVGLGLMYLPANVCVVWYFEKYRGLANGITLCGAGVGAFVFNNLGRYLIDLYGWRGFLLLEGSICLQCAAFGLMLLRPVGVKSLSHINKCSTAEPDESASEIERGDIMTVISVQNPAFIADEEELSVSKKTKKSVDILHKTSNDKHRKSQTFNSVNEEGRDSGSVNSSVIKERNEISCNHVYKYVRSYIYNDGLLMDKRFWALQLSTLVIFLSFLIPSSFTADHAIENGMSKYEASWLSSTIGITSAAGRVLFGLLGDQSCLNISVLVLVVLVLAGILTGVSVFLITFTGRMVYTCLYGLLTGGYYSLIKLVLAELFGIERVAKAFGHTLVTIGVGVTLSSAIAGFLYDKTGNYDVTFFVAGSELVLGAFIFIIPVCFCKKTTCSPDHLTDIQHSI